MIKIVKSGKKHLTGRLLFLMLILAPTFKAYSYPGPCVDATKCFCDLIPTTCEVLVTATLIKAGEQTSSIRVVGTPHYDPKGLVAEGQVLENLGSNSINVVGGWTAGRTGLFRVYPRGSCYPDRHYIAHAVLESEGKYLCLDDPEFPGATKEEVLFVVDSHECQREVHKLGVVDPCVDDSPGCCSGGD